MADTTKIQNLTAEQVAQTFSDYGYQPTGSDVSWWATQPDSAYPKLVSGLQKRKDKDVDDRLNAVMEQRKIIESQRAQSVNPTKGQSQDGMGGTPGSIAKDNVSISDATLGSSIGGKVNAYPLGDYSLVKFDDGPTVFLVDFKNRDFRPFLSWNAFVTSYSNPDEASKAIKVLPSSEYTQKGGALNDFKMLPSKYGISDNGMMKDPDYRDNNVRKRYGEVQASGEEYVKYANKLRNMFTYRLKNEKTGISSSFLQEVLGNDDLMAFYVNASKHGGYTFTDIYKDLFKRQSQAMAGTEYDDMRYIDDTKRKNEYANTKEGAAAENDVRIQIPKAILGDNASLWNTPVSRLPDDAFKPPAPLKTDAEYKALADKTLTDFHYVLMQKLNAKTDSEKAIADNEYNQFIKDTEKQFGIKLSSNAQQAWNQLQNVIESSSQAGLSGSGMEGEKIDDYLKAARLQDQQVRDVKLSAEEEAQKNYIRSYGSSSDIKKLDDEDAAKGLQKDQWRTVKWGLKPSQEYLDNVSASNLKKLYPNLTDDQINTYRNELFDEGGNFRSTLYQNQYEQIRRLKTGEKPLEEKYATGVPTTTDAAGNIIIGSPAYESSEEARMREQKQKDLDVFMEKQRKDERESGQRAEEQKFSDYFKERPKEERPAEQQTVGRFEWEYNGKTWEKKWVPGTGSGAQIQGAPSDIGPPPENPYQKLLRPIEGTKLSPERAIAEAAHQQLAPKKATLYGPPGIPPKVEIVGSERASDLQSQGWGLTPGSYKKPQMITGYKDGKPVQVPKGQHVPGVSLTPPTPQAVVTPAKMPTPTLPQQKIQLPDSPISKAGKYEVAPAKIPTPTLPQQKIQLPKFPTPPTGATRITGPSGLKGLKESQLWRDPSSKNIYRLAQGGKGGHERKKRINVKSSFPNLTKGLY